jgi:hypothetical protein
MAFALFLLSITNGNRILKPLLVLALVAAGGCFDFTMFCFFYLNCPALLMPNQHPHMLDLSR